MRMQLRHVLATLLIIGIATAAHAAGRSSSTVRIPGTYSNLRYNEDSGDLLGIEIKIVPVAGERLQAVVLASEGEPAPLVVVDVQRNGNTLSFRVPGDESWSFRGTVSAKALKGTITYGTGTRTPVTLLRGCGYWDR
jgi:hypothetical protein